LGQPASVVLVIAGAVRSAWMGESRFAPVPVAVYGGVLLFVAIAHFILSNFEKNLDHRTELGS
jgi:hypothetical protein